MSFKIISFLFIQPPPPPPPQIIFDHALPQGGIAVMTVPQLLRQYYALGEAHMRSTPSLVSLLNIAFETIPVLI